MNAACRRMGQRMGNTASIADDIQAGITGFQMIIDLHFHIVELNFYTVQQGVVVGGTGRNFIQCVDHLDDAVKDPLGQYQAQISGSGIECRCDKCFLNTAWGRTAAADQIAKPLHDHTAAKHIAQTGN